MTKKELSELLHSVCNSILEGMGDEPSMKEPERIVYYCIAEEDQVASGESYNNIATYQVDIWSAKPQCNAYRNLRDKLRTIGLHPQFFHEFVQNDDVYKNKNHTYFSLDVVENEQR